MSFQWGSIWTPTCLNFLFLKANKHWPGAYFPRLVTMYHCPISNVDMHRHPRKSTILLPSLSELALMLLCGVLYLPPRQREWYNEMVRVAPFSVTSVFASCSWLSSVPALLEFTWLIATLALPGTLTKYKYKISMWLCRKCKSLFCIYYFIVSAMLCTPADPEHNQTFHMNSASSQILKRILRWFVSESALILWEGLNIWEKYTTIAGHSFSNCY